MFENVSDECRQCVFGKSNMTQNLLRDDLLLCGKRTPNIFACHTREIYDLETHISVLVSTLDVVNICYEISGFETYRLYIIKLTK